MKRIVLFLLIMSCTLRMFAQAGERKVVLSPFELPFEITINGSEKLTIKEDGLVEFRNKLFVYKNLKYPINEMLVRLYSKNNLCGVNITEEVGDGAFISYAFIIDIKNQKLLPYERDEYFRFWGFFSIENCFILASGEKAYAFDDLTGELLWTQQYRQRNGRSILYNADHLVIDDIDGNKYRIYKDGRKIKI